MVSAARAATSVLPWPDYPMPSPVFHLRHPPAMAHLALVRPAVLPVVGEEGVVAVAVAPAKSNNASCFLKDQ
jgi:hypothetical protein